MSALSDFFLTVTVILCCLLFEAQDKINVKFAILAAVNMKITRFRM